MKPLWNAAPSRLPLSGNDLHVWRAGLDLPESSLLEFKGNLSSDEQAKAEHFRFARDGNRFIAARGILRALLSGYLNLEPGAIRFRYDEGGKPRLIEEFGKGGLRFNLSHSEGLALFAFTRDREVGVDIEYRQEIPEMDQIVEHFFSERERALFGSLPENRKKDSFFSWWTRKEAFIKAIGTGLSFPLETFDVVQAEGKQVRCPGVPRETSEGPGWSMWDLIPADGFAGALVVQGGGWELRCLQWQGRKDAPEI